MILSVSHKEKACSDKLQASYSTHKSIAINQIQAKKISEYKF